MPSKLKIRKTNGSTPVDSGFNNPDGSSNTYGVVGGKTSQSGEQVLVRVAIGMAGTGTVTTSTTSNAISGLDTVFDTQLSAGSVLTTSAGDLIGYIDSIGSANAAVLTANASVAVSEASFVFADSNDGYILRQKAKRKYLVANGSSIQDEDIVAGSTYVITDASGTNWEQFGAGPDATNGKIFTATINGSVAVVDNGVVNLVGVCKTANAADADLLPNTMSITATKTAGSTKLDSMTSHHALDFTDNGTDENAGTHYYTSFNGAVAADASAGRPYMVVDVESA